MPWAAEPAAHLFCLRSFGFPVSAVARAAGLSETALYELAKGRQRRVYAATREGLYRAHWAAWLHSGEFRLHCRCDVPKEVREEIEREEVFA